MHDPENIDPRSSPTSAIQRELSKQRARADDLARKLRNKNCKAI